jgi:23S rRNA (adenine2503-C2)-methyltransferase
MTGEVIVMNQLLAKEGENVSHIVVMGTGEPFDNYDERPWLSSISMNEQRGLAIGARHITVSTCGLVDGIKRYAEEGIQINLAISLHAPNDEIRKKIMPIANRYTIKDCSMRSVYIDKAGRTGHLRVHHDQRVNDSLECADELAI